MYPQLTRKQLVLLASGLATVVVISFLLHTDRLQPDLLSQHLSSLSDHVTRTTCSVWGSPSCHLKRRSWWWAWSDDVTHDVNPFSQFEAHGTRVNLEGLQLLGAPWTGKSLTPLMADLRRNTFQVWEISSQWHDAKKSNKKRSKIVIYFFRYP